jgi:3-phenylpropionate/cinnamic acid dioxygenase small subunit
MSAVDPAIKEQVERLVVDSAMFIDRDELDAWLDCFEPEGRYVVMPRDNRALGYPVGIIHCENKARIEDRIVCLRHANKYNPHYDRHILSVSRINSVQNGVAEVETNFMVVQTNKSGESKLFCAGCYEDRIRVGNGKARFVERIALLDTFSIPTMLATPV